MKTARSLLLIFTLVFSFAFTGLALADGHLAKVGERLSKTCASCHGTDGASPGTLIPIIGGQKAPYVATALKEFAADARPGSVMANLAKGYAPDEQKQIAAYFASKPWVDTTHASALHGAAPQVKSCQGCHAKDGKGQGIFPRLAGQHPEYLLEALNEYKQGQRKAATMMLVKGMDAVTLKNIADYYSALQ